jgi:hypothetical protein
MSRRRTPEQKRQDKLIEETCRKSVVGYSIMVLDIGKLFDAGKKAASAGLSDEEITKAIMEARDKYATVCV